MTSSPGTLERVRWMSAAAAAAVLAVVVAFGLHRWQLPVVHGGLGALTAAFARSSWSCTCTAAVATSSSASGAVGSSRSSWSSHLDPSSANG